MPSLAVLAASFIGGAAFVGLSGYGFRKVIRTTVSHSPHYYQALEYLRAHEESKKLLGEPIKQEGSMNVGDRKYFGEYKQYKYYTVPVQGSKTTGNLTYWIVDVYENSNNNNNNNNEPIGNSDSDRRYQVKKVLLEVFTKPKQIVWVKNNNKKT